MDPGKAVVLVDSHSKRKACRKFVIRWDTLKIKKILTHPQPPGCRR